MWDAAGKAAGLPVHRMLGTQRTEIPLYATYPPRQSTPEGYVSEALGRALTWRVSGFNPSWKQSDFNRHDTTPVLVNSNEVLS